MSPSSNPDFDLYTLLGEIRSDVKTLLTRSDNADRRIGWLEKKVWLAGGAGGVLTVIIPVAVAKALGWH